MRKIVFTAHIIGLHALNKKYLRYLSFFCVLFPDSPLVTCSRYEIYAKIGDKATLVCEVRANPSGSVFWMKNEKEAIAENNNTRITAKVNCIHASYLIIVSFLVSPSSLILFEVLQPLLCLRWTSSLERTPKRPPSVCTSS